MRKRESDFGTRADGEATLALPRFDESEAREASPVVPLSEVRGPRFAAVFGAFRNWRGPTLSRSWPLVLLLFAVLAAGAVGAAVYRQQRAARLASEPRPAPEEATQVRPADSTAPARVPRPESARGRRAVRQTWTPGPEPARGGRDSGGGDEAALAGIAIGNFLDDGEGDGKERKRKRRGGKRGGDDDREARAPGRVKFSRRDAARLVDVIRRD